MRVSITRGKLLSATWLLLAILSACTEGGRENDLQSEVDEPVGAYAVTDVNVVSVVDGSLLSGRTVLVEDGRITDILPAAGGSIPDGYHQIEGRGRYLAPGLADMHAHPFTQFDLDLYLANGVTLIRSMWGEPIVLRFRAEVAAGERRGPRIVTGGRIVDGEPVIHYGTDKVMDAEDAATIVTRQKEAGYDFIKVYSNLSLDAFNAIARTAKGMSIPFEGHIPRAVPAGHAFRSGMRSTEHLLGVGPATLAEGADYRTRFDPGYAEFAARLGSGAASLEDVYDADKLQALAELAAETGIWTVPTLVTLRGTALTEEEVQREIQKSRWRYVDYTVKRFWDLAGSMHSEWTEDTYRGAQLQLEHNLRQVKVFNDAGAPIMAGTDAPNPYALVGFGVVDELELYVQAGLSPVEALRTATSAPAIYMGEEGTGGIIAPGARADLVLLKENPLENVGAYRSIDGVMASGEWLDRASLDELLAGVARNNEYKASFFRDAPPWPVQEQEKLPVTAEFVLTENGKTGGAERVARALSADGSSALLGQRIYPDGSAVNVRVEIDDEGVSRVRVAEVGRAKNDVVVDISPADGQSLVLTDTAVDWLNLSSLLGGMEEGETLEREVLTLVEDGLQPARLTVTRGPGEVLPGHFYFTGVDRYDVTVTDDRGQSERRVWMGGGFYAGWPVRIEAGSETEPETAVRYKRIL